MKVPRESNAASVIPGGSLSPPTARAPVPPRTATPGYPPIRLGERILTGAYCVTCQVVGSPELEARVELPQRAKRYPFGFTMRYPGRAYLRLKYGINDAAEHDYRKLMSLPPPIRRFLPEQLHIAATDDGRTALCWRRVLDYTGRPSHRLVEVGRCGNEPFWRRIGDFVALLRQHRIPLMNAFRGGQQIIVQRVSQDDWRPVYTPDLVKLGAQAWPLQLHLWWTPMVWRKFNRQARRFYDRFAIQSAGAVDGGPTPRHSGASEAPPAHP